jgi:hypothetical protein
MSAHFDWRHSQKFTFRNVFALNPCWSLHVISRFPWLPSGYQVSRHFALRNTTVIRDIAFIVTVSLERQPAKVSRSGLPSAWQLLWFSRLDRMSGFRTWWRQRKEKYMRLLRCPNLIYCSALSKTRCHVFPNLSPASHRTYLRSLKHWTLHRKHTLYVYTRTAPSRFRPEFSFEPQRESDTDANILHGLNPSQQNA